MSGQSETEQTYDLSLLRKSEEKWRKSSGLRTVYGSIYEDIRKRMVTGASLELGSGIGGIKDFMPDIITSDIVKTPYVEMACSAYEIPTTHPQTGARWSNIIAVDVLHHLCRPVDFLSSAAAALGGGGKILLVEPAGTLYGKIFYGIFHPEPISPREIQPPFEFDADTDSSEFANMAMGTSLFVNYRTRIDEILNGFGLRHTELRFRDFLGYPLSGGYSSPQMLPVSWINGITKLERQLPQWLLKWIALRMLIVIEKR